MSDPHIRLRTLDGNQHVIPRIVFTQIVHGERSINEIDDYEIIMRSIIADWLTLIPKEGTP